MSALSPPKHRPGRAWLGTRPRSNIAQASRYLGALAVLATGLAHIEQYSVDNDSTVQTIGTRFIELHRRARDLSRVDLATQDPHWTPH